MVEEIPVMSYDVQIVADSISPQDHRLTTFVLTYPRFVHAELMTHRQFSRNASSSRAIPVKKIIQQIIDDPAMPVFWGRNQAGMQASAELSDHDKAIAEMIWLQARDQMVLKAQELLSLDVHKQLANRILEPWHHIKVVLTATDFANFFGLRCHKDAQPEIRVLAEKMAEAYRDSIPNLIRYGDFHLPFITDDDRSKLDLRTQIKCSVARCARVSYMRHDGTEPVIEDDLALHDRLLAHQPIHASPAEHPARPCLPDEPSRSNFTGWKQYRKTLSNECILTLPWEETLPEEVNV